MHDGQDLDATDIPFGYRYTLTEGPPEAGGRAINLTSLGSFMRYNVPVENITKYSVKFYANFEFNLPHKNMDFLWTSAGIAMLMNPNGTFKGSQYLFNPDNRFLKNFQILLDSNPNAASNNEAPGNEAPLPESVHLGSLHRWILFGFSFDMQPDRQNYKFYMDGKLAGSYSESRNMTVTSHVKGHTMTFMVIYRASYSCLEFTYNVEDDAWFGRNFNECSE